MYEEFFGLSEKPFALTPNPRYVFYSQQYREAEEQLLYGIAQKEGFMLLTGRPGTGKTTLCRDLLEKLDTEKHRSALMFNPFLSGVEMLQALLTEFGVSYGKKVVRKDLLDLLNAFLLEQLSEGRTCVAIFDEAQHLSTEFLEQIRVLSNLETETEKLIQIVLVGQPELLDRIRTPGMAQLDQRVSVRCTLTDLSVDETQRYIYHRLHVAGAAGHIEFSKPAVRQIHRESEGVPRVINLICDRALLAAYVGQVHSVGPAQVTQALSALRGDEGVRASVPDRVLRDPRLLVAAAVLLIALVVAGAWTLQRIGGS